MAKLNMLLIVMIVILLVVAFDPRVRAQTLDAWNTFEPVLVNLKEGLTVIFHQITNNASDVPGEDKPPVNDGPVYHAYLFELTA